MSSERKFINIYAQGSIAEFENDGDDADRYYLPVRSLAFYPSDPDGLFIFPDTPDIRRYHQDLTTIYAQINRPDLASSQPIFVPDSHYLLDDVILEELPLVASRLDRAAAYQVRPYASTEKLALWVNALAKKGFNIHSSLPQRIYYGDLTHPAHRGGWGRWVDAPDEPSFPERFGIPYPVSFLGRNLDEVNTAYSMVTKATGDNRAFFKPVFSAGGFTLKQVESEAEVAEHYQALQSQGALDILGQSTPVEIQALIPNLKTTFGLQYDGDRIVTPSGVSVQLMADGNKWAGNAFNSETTAQFASQARTVYSNFRKGMREYGGLYGSGGIDLGLSQGDDGDSLVMIEHNGQRITGAHPAIALAQGLGVENSAFMLKKSLGFEPASDLKTLWEELAELRFNPDDKRGVFPIVWTSGSGILWCCADTIKDCQSLLDSSYNRAIQRGLVV